MFPAQEVYRTSYARLPGYRLKAPLTGFLFTRQDQGSRAISQLKGICSCKSTGSTKRRLHGGHAVKLETRDLFVLIQHWESLLLLMLSASPLPLLLQLLDCSRRCCTADWGICISSYTYVQTNNPVSRLCSEAHLHPSPRVPPWHGSLLHSLCLLPHACCLDLLL